MNDDTTDPQLARLVAMVEELERDAERSARELAASNDQRAERARAGELGEDWQRTQERIDRGETTLAAVFAGADDDPAARRLLGTSRERIETIAGQAPAPTELVEALEAADAELEAVRTRAPLAP